MLPNQAVVASEPDSHSEGAAEQPIKTGRLLRAFLSHVSFIILLGGTGGLGYGIYAHFRDSGRQPGIFWGTMESGRQVGVTIARFLCSSVLLPIGLTGFVAAELDKMCLILVLICLLVTGILLNATFGTYMAVRGFKSVADKPDEIQKAVRQFYGNLGDKGATEFTRDLDAYQAEHLCCGWSGLYGPNLFAQSPWYQVANKGTTAGNPQTLPQSCCVSRDANRTVDISDSCLRAVEVNAARLGGFAFAEDCLDQKTRLDTKRLQIFVYLMAAVTFLEICCIPAAVALLKLPVERAETFE